MWEPVCEKRVEGGGRGGCLGVWSVYTPEGREKNREQNGQKQEEEEEGKEKRVSHTRKLIGGTINKGAEEEEEEKEKRKNVFVSPFHERNSPSSLHELQTGKKKDRGAPSPRHSDVKRDELLPRLRSSSFSFSSSPGCHDSSAVLSSLAGRRREAKEEESCFETKKDKQEEGDEEREKMFDELKGEIFLAVRDIRDPEFPVYTLGELGVVTPELIHIEKCRHLPCLHEKEEKERKGRRVGRKKNIQKRQEQLSPIVMDPSFSSSARSADQEEVSRETGSTEIKENSCYPRNSSSSSSRSLLSSAGETDQEKQAQREEEEEEVRVELSLRPTNARCSMASLIGLAVRCKLNEAFSYSHSLSPDFFSLLHLFHKQLRQELPIEEEEEEGGDETEEEKEKEEDVDECEKTQVEISKEEEKEERKKKKKEQRKKIEEEEEEREDVDKSLRKSRRDRRCVLRYVDIRVVDHEDEINLSKQLNDKERIFAALENPSIRQLILSSISEDEDLHLNSLLSTSSSFALSPPMGRSEKG